MASIAVLGLGAMGAGMAHRLIETGRSVVVYNRTAAKAEPLRAAGAAVAATAAEAARGADTVLVCLSDETAVEDVLFGEVVPVLEPGTTVVNTTSVSARYARSVAARLTDAGLRPVEAAVVGNPGMARSGRLRVLTAGDRADVAAVEPILGALGQESRHLGAPGTAAAAKLAFNLLLGAQVAALAEAVALGVATGIDREQILDAIAGSGFSSPVLAFRAEFMRARRYEPAAFRSRLMLKDLRNALDDASGAGHRLPVTGAVADAFAATVDAGAGDQDAAVLVETFLDSPSRKDALR